MSKNYSIAIIWWGAAGMMCAASLLEWTKDIDKLDIHLFEKNSRLGAKVIISGWGRCNVTTWTFKRKELLQHYTRWAGFLDHAFRQFWPKKVRKRFEDHGVPLKQENDGRIFPVSDDGKDIVAVFEKLFAEHKAQIHFKEAVDSISQQNNAFLVTTAKTTYTFDKVVIASWWEAYAHTGSTGDGYSFAREMWHTITQLWPSLNSFVCEETWIHDCSGISFPKANLQATCIDTIKQSGPVLLTHFGITWPHTFVLASHCAFTEISKEQPLHVTLKIDVNRSYERRDAYLLEQIKAHPKKRLNNILATQLPKRFVEHFLAVHGYQTNKIMADVSKTDRKHLAQLLWTWIPLTLIKRRPGDEFVTAGGVVTDEVNEKTMESKLIPWLYFVWEILNVDGITGGYNLQASWAAGYLAGKAIAQDR